MISIMSGSDIIMERCTAGPSGYGIFDIEPEAGSIAGITNVWFSNNTATSYRINTFVSINGLNANKPISNINITDNVMTGTGDAYMSALRVYAIYATVNRIQDLTITGNDGAGSHPRSTRSCSVRPHRRPDGDREHAAPRRRHADERQRLHGCRDEPEPVSIPSRPIFQPQNPAYSHDPLGWLSCTAYSGAMLADRSTLGAKRPSGRDVRAVTGDTTGGLTLPQVARALETEYGVAVEVHTGSRAATPAYTLSQLRNGRGMILQGNAGALLHTPYRSTSGYVNHAVYANEARADNAVLVYDPAADGRRAGIDLASSWWPWDVVLRFAAALRPWGNDDRRVLGPGRLYAGFGPDTEPHVHLRYGAKRTSPFPDRTRVAYRDPHRLIVVRSRPSMSGRVVDRMAVGELFTAYQHVVTDRHWYGSHDGTEWIADTRLSHTGGST